MKVLQIYMRNPLRNFNYIVYSEVNHKAIFVDPLDIDKTLPAARERGLEPAYLLNTHSHPDHVKDNERFLEQTGARHLRLKDGEEFALSPSETLKAIYTPGHIDDHYCYVLSNDGSPESFLSGDTLFNAGVGHCKLGGDPDTLYETITTKIASLPEELLMYPGHDYLLNNLRFAKTVDPENEDVDKWLRAREAQNLDEEFPVTDLKTEKRINPFLRLEKLRARFDDKSPKEVFLELRALRDKW